MLTLIAAIVHPHFLILLEYIYIVKEILDIPIEHINILLLGLYVTLQFIQNLSNTL